MYSYDRKEQRKQKNSKVFLIGLLFLVIGGCVYQQYYLRTTWPIIQAQLAEAERVGPQFFEQLPLPAGATPRGSIKQSPVTGGRRGQWQGTTVGVRYEREWEAPGTIADLQKWYIQELSADGWTRIDADRPTEVQTRFRKEKWFLTVGHNVWFGGSKPYIRFDLDLEWSYLRP